MTALTDDEVRARFRALVRKGPGCWVWAGGTFADGYGAMRFRGRTERAPRLAFFFEHGRWPDPCALHECDYEGTKKRNAEDMMRRGRGAQRRHRAVRLSVAKAAWIRAHAGRLTHQAMADALGVSRRLVTFVVAGETWR